MQERLGGRTTGVLGCTSRMRTPTPDTAGGPAPPALIGRGMERLRTWLGRPKGPKGLWARWGGEGKVQLHAGLRFFRGGPL